eukprot:364074-Chlamydomonas_euryale.AAC.4
MCAPTTELSKAASSKESFDSSACNAAAQTHQPWVSAPVFAANKHVFMYVYIYAQFIYKRFVHALERTRCLGTAAHAPTLWLKLYCGPRRPGAASELASGDMTGSGGSDSFWRLEAQILHARCAKAARWCWPVPAGDGRCRLVMAGAGW